MAEHLKHFVTNGYWNDTLIIFMSDHGCRMGGIRATAQGKVEERLPFMSFAFPPWFKKKYPESMRVFKENAHRLTSPFDIHPTLQEILNFDPVPKMGNSSNRQLSLFHRIPANRTCDQAGIEVQWCTCLQWSEVSTKNAVVQTIARALVERINAETGRERKLCAKLKLTKVEKALIYQPADELLKYAGVKDRDGFVPDLSGKKISMNIEHYQVDVWTDPGNAHYEATIVWDKRKQQPIINLNDVSHVSRYGDKPHCVIDKDYFLAKWCVCYDKI